MSEELTRSQKYYQENKEKIIEYNKNYYQANIFDKRVYNILYYHKNKEHLKEKHRLWREKNKVRVNKKYREEYYPRYVAKLCGDKTVQETLEEINNRKEEKQKRQQEPLSKRVPDIVYVPPIQIQRGEITVSFD